MSEDNLIDVMGLGAESFEPAQPDPLGANLARAHLSPIANRVQNVNLADSIGSTLDYASVNRDDIMRRRALEAIDPQAIRAQTPAFAEWAAKDEANAVMSVNDMGWFQSAEHILKSAANEFEVGVASSEASRLDAYEALARLTGTPGLNEADKARLASIRSGIDSAGSYSGTGGIFSDAIISAAQIAPSLLDVVSQTAKGGAVGAGVGALSGSVVPGVGTIAGLISGATTGASAGAIESSAMQNFGSMVREFSQLKDENGNLIDQNTADIAAAIATLPVAALDRFSNGKMTALIPDILNIKEQLARYGLRNAVKIPTVRSALMRGARDYVTSVGTEAVTEGLQQGIQATARYLVNPDANKQFDAASIMAEMGSAAYQAGLGTAVIGITGGAINTRNMVNNVRAGERDPEVIAQRTASLHEHMQSKTGQESLNTSAPRLRDFMKSADGGAQVFIDPKPMQELFQSLPDDTRKVLLDALPGFQGQLEEAAAADTDIIMRRGDYAALFASQPWSEPLIPHVRENQLDVSAAELKALIENKDVQNDIEQAASMERLETRLQRRLQDSIQNAGVTPAIASDNSRLLERFIGRTDRLRSLAGETGDISAKLERALSFRRSASEYTHPERIDELTQHLTNIKARISSDKPAPRVNRRNYPVLDYIVKTTGGIDPEGDFGRYLASEDITPKTHRWIFKKGGAGEIDTINASDMRDEFVNLNIPDTFAGGGATEATVYASTNLLRELVRNELHGKPSVPVGKEQTARSAAEDNLLSLLDDGLGLSLKEIEALTPERLKELLAEYERGVKTDETLNQFDQESGGTTPYTAPTITVDGKERPTTNSKGQPIAATKEGLENFWRWFGDSKVVDAEGKPLVVYHGGFDPAKAPEGEAVFLTRAEQAAAQGEDYYSEGYDGGNLGQGFYFTPDKNYAKRFGEPLEYYLRAQNPLDVREQETIDEVNRRFSEYGDELAFGVHAEIIDEMVAEGKYDSVVGEGVGGLSYGSAEWMVIDRAQIKSIYNRGTFSQQDARVLYQGGSYDMRYFAEAKKMSRALTAMGFETKLESSRVSKSEYVYARTPDYKQDDDGNVVSGRELKLRFSDHELPYYYDQADFDVVAVGGKKHDGAGGSWGEAIEWISKVTGVKPKGAALRAVNKIIKDREEEKKRRDVEREKAMEVARLQNERYLDFKKWLETLPSDAVIHTSNSGRVTAKSGERSYDFGWKPYGITKGDLSLEDAIKFVDYRIMSNRFLQQNRGTFSREDNNILHQSATDPDASPWYYSQVQRVVENLKQNKATGEQWLKTIQNTPGVKQEELDWMGLPEWLAAQEGSITKVDLMQFIEANQIKVDEVVKGTRFAEPDNASYSIEPVSTGGFEIVDDRGVSVEFHETLEEADAALSEYETGVMKEDDTEFGQYVLPGGENYRELLMTLPSKPLPDIPPPSDVVANYIGGGAWQIVDGSGDKRGVVRGVEGADKAILAWWKGSTDRMMRIAEQGGIPDSYHSSHFDEKNILAHIRFNERTDADGKRVLFVEEIQSDWHQEGRDKGYKGDLTVRAVTPQDGISYNPNIPAFAAFDANGKYAQGSMRTTLEEAQAEANRASVHDAPFKTTWPELAFKRALRWAVDNGFDRVAWTTGEQQADRYDLSKQVDTVEYFNNPDGTVLLRVAKGSDIVFKEDNVTKQRATDVVGKEVADKINFTTEPVSPHQSNVLSGVDLKVGGEGMRAFYDKMLPNMVNKMVKKWGGKVGETAIDTSKTNGVSDIRVSVYGDGSAQVERGSQIWDFDTEAEADAFRKELLTKEGATQVHSLDITPEMRAAAKAGLALFQESRGSISFDAMLEKVVISLSSGANLSTMLHEFGHYASLLHRQTAQIARDALAAGKVTDPAARAELEQVIKDWDTLKEKLGVTGDTLTVDQEEQIAKWFEQYLREGKAPSADLNDIFATFKSWLLQIYKTIKDLGKPINDDVRQVFDRWLASDEEIKAAQSVNLQIEQIAAQFDMLDTTGLSKEQAEARAAVGAKVARLLNKSGNRASEALLAEVLAEESKKQTAEYKADYAKTLDEVTKAADESRVYAAQDHIKAGHRLDAKLVEQVVGKDIAKRLPNGLRGGNSNPDLIAMQFGYIDGAEMIREIVSNVPKKVFIAQETERLMQARHGNMLEDGRAAERARVLVANDEVGEAIELLVKTSGEKKQTRRLVKAAARQRMLNTRYADITPGKYSAARDKALRAAYAAGTKAKGGDAAQHLWKAMLNHELLMAANQAKADQAKAQKLYDKINKKDTKLPDSWDAEYVYFARYLLANAGLSTNRGFNPNKWLVDAQERNPELMGQLAEAYKDFMPEKNWKSMTALELSSLHMVVQNIIHIGRENKAFVRAGEKTTIENALSEIVQSLQSQGYSTVQPPLPSSMTMGAKAAKVLYDMEGSLVRIEALCKHLDGGNSFGPMSQSIYRPISDAVNRGKPISNAFITKLAKVMAEREAEYSSSGSIAAPELFSEHFNGVFRNKWDVIACLLNYGNASSATKLIDGYKWNEDDLLGVFNKHLNARDVEFVQRIWDVLNEVKPYVKEEYYQRTGLSLVEIEPRAFDLHGQTWRGGYYPAAYSREHVVNSKIGERADLDQSLFGAEGSSWPAPNKGSSIERTEYVGPIDLNPMVSIRHVEQSIHRWAVAKDIRQTARLVNRPEFQSAMAAINPSYRGLFMPWLRAVARDTVDDAAMTSWDKAAKILRNRATVMIMGLNLRNAMQNLSGYPIVSREIGGKYFMEGMASYAENPQAATDFIFERSAEMKMRYQNLDREQQEVLRDIAAGKKTAIGKLNSKIQPYAFAMSNATDALVSRPAWLGAYKKAKAENKSDADAAYYADSVVRLNVGIGNVKDVAALQRGNQFARTTLVMFYSYMNMVYNLNRSEFLNLKRTGASGIPSFLAGQMLVNIIPNLIAAGIVDALGGGGAGADDEDWMWWYSRRVFSGMFGLVPIVGDFGELIIDEATNEKFFDRFQNPVFSMLGTIGSAVIGDGEAFFQEDPNYSQVVKTTITAMAGTFGTPINDLRHPLGTLADWAEGDSEPVGVWQAVQQLMGAPPPKD